MIEEKKELEDLRHNILNWYPFKENKNVLEIWDGKVIPEDIQDKSYDYVAVLGIGDKKIEELIDISISKLKDDGILLIAVDNELGINDLCSEFVNNLEKVNRTKIRNYLINKGFGNQKIYYPLPNYKYTNVIFTDDFLPNYETINRCITFYDDNTLVALDERKRFKKIINEDIQLFKIFTNSFFIECSKIDFKDNEIKFVSFSNARKKEYRVKTIIKGDTVYKYAVNEEGKEHLEDIKRNIDILKSNNLKTIDTYDDEKIISKFIDNSFLINNIIIEKAKCGKKQEILDLIKNYQNELINKFEIIQPESNCFDKYAIQHKKEDIEKLHFIKYGLWDMFFQNCFYIDNEFYFYDQEWLEDNLPVEFIMYRAIKYFGQELYEVISTEELYNIINIRDEQIEIFEKLDDLLQENIRDKDIWEDHKDKKSIARFLTKINNLQKELIDKNLQIEDLNNKLQEKDSKIKNLEDELNGIKNSKTWKITEPLRKVNKSFKDKEKK